MDLKSLLCILLLIWIVGYVNLYFKELNHLSNVESFDNQLDDDNIEGFSNNMKSCRDNYTKEFCNSAANPGECLTPYGLKGVLSKEFKGPDGPLCVVNEEQEDRLVGIGLSSRDPSILMDKSATTRRKLKWKDITKPIDIEAGPRYAHRIYKSGVDQENKEIVDVEAFNIFPDIWDQYFSNI